MTPSTPWQRSTSPRPITLTAALSLVGALVAASDFLTNFENFRFPILSLFIPWTAVNLVDYHLVRRGNSAFMGLPVSWVLSFVLGRSVDLDAEIAVEQAQAADLQRVGTRS